jgi:N-hydroxyarylamine O-acetyltransferase
MDIDDVQKKLVHDVRGGYCFEQNTLLKAVLEEMGYSVEPLLCRVRWGKDDDSDGPNTSFTHLVLKVFTKDGIFLADVGFAGTNSIEPVKMDIGTENQELPEGRFHIVPSKHKGFFVLELLVKEEWRPLYEWRDEKAPLVDQECCNWFSCTNPKGRFTSQFFVCKIIGEERHHILNDQYVIRNGFGASSRVTTETISDKGRLVSLVSDVFGIRLEDTSGINRFLS